MAAYGAGNYRASQGRGTAPGFSFTLYAVLAIVLMVFDRRGGWLGQARYYLSATAYPLQLAVNSPSQALRWTQDSLTARETLQAQNAALRARDRELSLKVMRFEALARENAELRGLRTALPPLADHWLAAEVIDSALNGQGQRQRLLINRGARNGVFKGQAVMDNYGLLGQTTRVGPWSAEVILITDLEHAVPVEVERTGVHTIAEGTNDSDFLALPYLPANADLRAGDLLLTSGLGGVFPQGYPVARVAADRHDRAQAPQFLATPLAHLNALHEVTLVWFEDTHPAAPVHLKEGETANGSPALQPQPAPPLELLPMPTSPRLTPLAIAPAASSAPGPKPTGGKPAGQGDR